MARIKLSEYRAKNLLYAAFGTTYKGKEVDLTSGEFELPEDTYVVKVDQAVKRRNTLGLVRLNRTSQQAATDLKEYAQLGYSFALIEPPIKHDQKDELFLSLLANEGGVEVQFSTKGGVSIEDNKDSLKSAHYSYKGELLTNKIEGLDEVLIAKILNCFLDINATYLEINPFIIRDGAPIFLDAALEVDSSARFWSDAYWNEDDERGAIKNKAEEAVETLSAKSPASLTLKVLSPNGSVFLLLSGGGASVVVADEIAAQIGSDNVANYGEYSGNPNEEETYLYTKSLLGLLVASKAPKKVLLIAGGVANFTDVAKTFKGIIHALTDEYDNLKNQDLTVMVRRGGPNQKAGLAAIQKFLDDYGYKNEVHGPEVSLAAIAQKAAAVIGAHHE